MTLTWGDQYSLGISIIDKQHQQFVAALNELIGSIGSLKKNNETIEAVFKKITDYARYHFDTEEKYFLEFNYAGAEEHVGEHIKFKQRLIELKEQYLKDEVQATFSLADYLEDWLINHLNKLDKKYVQCFKDHGLK